MKFLHYILPLFVLFASCTSLPEADFYEVEGVLSIDPSVALPADSWSPTQTHLYSYLISGQLENRSGSISVSVYFQTPGSYELWLLGGREPDMPNQHPVIQITDSRGIMISRSRIEIPRHERLRWLNRDTDGLPIVVDAENPGLYTLSVESGGEEGIKIGKLHLSLNGENPPEGMGYLPTSNPRVDPTAVKRDHHVEIPPADAFGLIAGGSSDQYNSLTEAGIPISYWWDQSGHYEHVDSIHNLNVIDFAEDIEELSGLFEFSKTDESRRGFFLANAVELDNANIKRYPALWHSDSTLSGFEQLKRQIAYLSDSAEPLYEIPYFAAMPGWGLNFDTNTPTDELMMRWIQFSAFSTLMAVPLPPGQISDQASDQLGYYTSLRTELFPYIYSYTLRSRTARVKHVTGDTSHPHQFLFGNELLVAPVVEEGAEDRFVWFPEGLWYSYWDDERFEGGQAWAVDTPIDRIPVFVRAGSIIPKAKKGSDSDELDIIINTGSPGTFRLYEDDGETLSYWQGDFSTTAFRYFEQPNYATFTIGARVRGFESQPEEVSYRLRFKFMESPTEITVNGEELDDRWYWDEETEEVVIPWTQPANARSEFRFGF